MNPGCNDYLFREFEDGHVTSIEEQAHIIARNEGGPRGTSDLQPEVRDEYENVILLCRSCHGMIDKAPDHFPVDLLHEWKRNHAGAIQSLFRVEAYADRASLEPVVHRLLRENHALFEQYGPQSNNRRSPLSDAGKAWTKAVRETIIPNNQKVSELLKRNHDLLDDEEAEVLQRFILHKDGLAYNHLSGDKNAAVPMFPEGMSTILRN
jgi:hypothetical protein